MNRISLLPLMLVSVTAWSQETAAAAHDEQAVIVADQQWGDAETNGDSAYLEALLLDGYQSIGSSGKATTKTQIVEGARKRGKSAQYAKMIADWKAQHPLEPHVALYGDTAVLTWVSATTGSPAQIYSSDVFVYRDGQWRAVYSQHSTAAETAR